MSWISNFVRPKIRTLLGKKDIPDNLWIKCTNCQQMIFHRDIKKSLYVCPHCDHHLQIVAEHRFETLFDKKQYNLIELPKTQGDPLNFRDLKKYKDRIKEARARTKNHDAMKAAIGKISNHNAVIAVLDFSFMGGSMGQAVGESFVIAAKHAVKNNAIFIVIPSSGGARMQEGALSLMQMPRTIVAIDEFKESGLPYIVILSNPTTGGVSASFAMLGDVTIAEPYAIIGFAGSRVIERTIKQTLPDGFQRSEYLLEHGMIDMVVHRRDLQTTLERIIDLLMNKNLNKGKSSDTR